MLALSVLVFLGIFVLNIAFYFRRKYKYWEKKGVGYLEPKFPLGNSSSALPTGMAIGIGSKKYYDALKRKGLKYGGIYMTTEPVLVVTDPDYIRDILTKDFQHFVGRGVYVNERDDPMGYHLFSADSTRWRQLRVKLTPTFTSGKMKEMFQIVMNCSENMINTVKGNSGNDFELKDTLARFTIDVIGSVAFGIDCNSFKNPDAEFRRMGIRNYDFDFWMSVKAFFALNVPKLSQRLGIILHHKEVIEFFTKSVRDVTNYRRSNNIRRNDFLQILIDLNENGEKITFNEIVAQCFLFFNAGFETSSVTMSFALYELSKDSKMQEKLRDEINMVLAKHDDKMTYENLNEMEYLDQIVSETMRKYPVVSTLNRICTMQYRLRGTDVVIEEGTPVLLPVFALHRDPEYFPDPERFEPSRFSNEMKFKRHPYTYLPFGEGPRNCIGLRFGWMQTKIGIASIVRNFRLRLSPRTKPVTLDPHAFLLRSVDPIYVEISCV